MKYFLGISSLDCDSTVTIVNENGKILYAAQEERFTRVKQQDGFPYKTIQNAFEYLNITIDDIENIAYGWYTPEIEQEMAKKSGKEIISYTGWNKRPFLPTLRNRLNFVRRAYYINMQKASKYNNQLLKGLKDIGYKKDLKRFHHQDSHAASVYYTSGFSKALIFTLDGYGSGACGGVFLGDGHKIEALHYINSPQSIGNMYARVTKALGFIPNRHEGKILGLAAYGNPDTFFTEIMQDFELTSDGYVYHNSIDPYIYKDIFKRGSKEDLAASFQKVLETIATHLVKIYVDKYQVSKICLAGGVAANVKMNQRIMELSGVSEIYVHPGMADCGIGTGAALLSAHEQNPFMPKALKDVYLGPDYSDEEIKKAIEQFDFPYEYYDEIELKIAELLAQGKVVGRFHGRMEYGPRALCNRTIYAPTQDSGINKWLNKRLNRTEFMPFAPVTLDYMADKMYLNMEKVRYTSKFMTTTVDCTEEMKRLSPAAVHVDGTARPQLVNAIENPSPFKVLDAYYKLTGIPNLVNTSYNMHEEPIICNPYDAVKAFKDGRLDYLALGNYLLISKD
jgi:carbamoyltransferase